MLTEAKIPVFLDFTPKQGLPVLNKDTPELWKVRFLKEPLKLRITNFGV